MRRWSGALALGACVTAAALAFGSRPLTVAGAGLLLAAGLSRVWAGLARGDAAIAVSVAPERPVEGDRVRLQVQARRSSRIPVGSASLRLRLGKRGEYELRLHGRGRTLRGALDLGPLPRGVFPLTDVHLVLGDHLGLGSVAVAGRRDGATVVVYPRLVGLRGVFSEGGASGGEGRRLLLRRSAGFDFHSVREYEQGESLRRVHWATTARRGRLMVKELHDAPGDDVVVVLDCDPAGVAGTPPGSSFDVAVRAAGSILQAHAARGRSATLVTTGSRRVATSVRSGDGDLDGVLAVLAAAEPDASHGLARSLRADEPALTRASEIAVVTGAPLATVAPMLARAAAHRLVSVVWVDAPSLAGRPTRADPGLLRLAGSGIPVAVVRHGDDLAVALAPSTTRRAVRA